MSELDAFETRFAAAYRRYVDKAPRGPDAASVAHTVTAQPRGRAIAWPWNGRQLVLRPAQALAWLVILGLLIAAFAAGIFVGSQPRPLPAVVPTAVPAFACPSGLTPNTPGPVDQVRPAGINGMAFDRLAGRLVALASPNKTAGDFSVETWTFDVCANTWLQMHPDQEPPPGMGGLVYDVDSDVTIAAFGPFEQPGNMWVYDLEANTWRKVGPFAPVADRTFSSLEFYDPVSGRVVARGDDGDEETLGLALWAYEVETDTWTPISQAEPLVIGPHFEFLAYDPASNGLVAYAKTWQATPESPERVFDEAKTWLFDLRTGTWSGTNAVTPPYFNAGIWGLTPGIAYDEAAQRTVMMGQGYSAAYDARADRWETIFATPSEEAGVCGTRPECRQTPQLVYDSVNERLVVRGGSVYVSAKLGWVDPSDILAYDTRTGDWTVLLEAR